MIAAIKVETLKLLRSPVGAIGTLTMIGGTLALLAAIMAALTAGNPEVTAKVGTTVTPDWHGLLAASAQITSAGGLLGSGIVLAWMFGREFADGTITSLFALPVRRSRIALAKFIVFSGWAAAVALTIALGILALGLVLGYGTPSVGVWAGMARQIDLTLFSAALAAPVAWLATMARSLLAAVSGAVGLVVIAQTGAMAAGGWLPLAAPALWAMGDGTAVNAVQLSLSAALAALFIVLTCVSWARLQLNR